MQTSNFYISKVQTNVLQERETKIGKEIFPIEVNSFSNVGGYRAFSVICRISDNMTMVIPQNILEDAYFHYLSRQVSHLFTKTIGNLLNIRKHLALQLDLEYGNITEEYFAKEEKTCLFEIEKIPNDELQNEISLLYQLTNMPLDSEEIAGILNCPIDDAEKAIRNVLLKD